MSVEPAPFLQPGIAWALVVVFSVLWVALGMAWGRRGSGNADDYMLAGRNIGLALSTATLMASWVTGTPRCWHRNSAIAPVSGECSVMPSRGWA